VADSLPEIDEQRRQRVLALAVANRAMIEAYAFAITRDVGVVEDVYQEVAVVMTAQWEKAPEGEAFRFWLKEVIRRKAKELIRRETRTRALAPDALARVESALPDESEDPRLGESLAGCVEKLAGDAREAILGRYRLGLDVPSIAARIGRSVQGTYAVLKRARLALEDCVDRARRQRGATP
jgi:RNA polymerase sigma factor (sigma-70 family)